MFRIEISEQSATSSFGGDTVRVLKGSGFECWTINKQVDGLTRSSKEGFAGFHTVSLEKGHRYGYKGGCQSNARLSLGIHVL